MVVLKTLMLLLIFFSARMSSFRIIRMQISTRAVRTDRIPGRSDGGRTEDGDDDNKRARCLTLIEHLTGGRS